MYKLALILGIGLCLCSAAFGQNVPRGEVFGGYSYVNVDTNGLTSRQSANGWEVSASGDINRWFAVEGDLSGYYKTFPVDLSYYSLPTTDVDVRDFGFVVGPRLNYGPVFAHVLVGFDHLSGSAFGYSASQDSFASAWGGGVELPMTGRWAARLSGDYVLTHHNIFGGPSFTQNNFRFAAGIVFRFGNGEGMGSGAARAGQPARVPPSEAPLFGVSGYSEASGFLVESVQPNSPAAQAGISPDDVVQTINGHDVHTNLDIESAIASRTSATIKVQYAIKGAWLTERDVTIH